MRRCIVWSLLVFAAACTPDVPTASPVVGSIAPVTTNLVVYPDPMVAESIAVVVKDHRGAPMAGAKVVWSTGGDGGKVQPLGDVTLEDGTARALWYPAGVLGQQEVYASTGDLPKVTIVAEAKSYPLHGLAGTAQRVCGINDEDRLYCLIRGNVRKMFAVVPDTRYAVVVASDLTTCAARIGGGVDCFTWNGTTGLPNPVTYMGATPTLVSVTSDIDAGGVFCGLTTEGQAWCWGNGGGARFGKGVGTLTSPQPVLGSLRFRTIALGDQHGCGVTLDRTAWCWGYNLHAELGLPQDPAGSAARDPVQVPGLGPTAQLVIGGTYSTCALGDDAQVRCWGNRYDGGLGLGYREGQAINQPVTSPVLHVGAASGIASLWWGYAAQAGDGKLYTWQISMNEPMRVASATRFRNLLPSQVEASACGQDFSGGVLCVDMSNVAFRYDTVLLRHDRTWAIPAPTP